MIFGVVQYKLRFLQNSERSATKKALARQAVKFKNLNGLL